MSNSIRTRTQADRADQARVRILEAATAEFSAHGLAGARTERIAEAAGVNKALLYYYFCSKNALYAATLECVADRMAVSNLSVLNRDCSAGEKLLRSALNHFDRIYSNPQFQALMQQEMIRLRKGETSYESPLIEKLFKPSTERLLSVIQEGIGSGELIDVEPTHLIYASVGPNVFYFLSAPLMHFIIGQDPFEPAALEFRRRAVVNYLGAAFFLDRKAGAALAATVLAETQMPAQIVRPSDPFDHKQSEDRATNSGGRSANQVRYK